MAMFAPPLALHAAPSNVIRVVVKGLNSDQGRVGCGLFKGPDGFPRDRSKAFAGMWAPIRHRVAVCTFRGVPPASYAVTVLDDDNMDGTMDFGHLGLPKKGYGFSNNVHAMLRSPSFEAASFEYSGKGILSVPIDIVYPWL
jgi:uncharacterized protein (DUF2141 family)